MNKKIKTMKNWLGALGIGALAITAAPQSSQAQNVSLEVAKGIGQHYLATDFKAMGRLAGDAKYLVRNRTFSRIALIICGIKKHKY